MRRALLALAALALAACGGGESAPMNTADTTTAAAYTAGPTGDPLRILGTAMRLEQPREVQFRVSVDMQAGDAFWRIDSGAQPVANGRVVSGAVEKVQLPPGLATIDVFVVAPAGRAAEWSDATLQVE